MSIEKDHHSIKNELARATDLDNVAEKLGSSLPHVFAEAAPNGEESLANNLTTLLKNIVAYDARAKQWYLWDGKLHKPVEAGESIDITAGFALLYLKTIIEAFAEYHGDTLTKGATALEAIKLVTDKDEKQKLQETNAETIDASSNVSAALAGPVRMVKALQRNRDQKSLAEMLQRKLPLNAAKRDADDERYLVFQNGVLDMQSIQKTTPDSQGGGVRPKIELLNHSASRLVWRMAQHDWNPDAEAPNWEKLLSRDSFYDDHEARILEQIIGIGLSGQVKHFPKHMVSLFGETNSGKGLIGEALKRFFPDHVSINDQRIVQKMRSGGDEQARLRHNIKHSRVVIASECTAEVDGDFLLNYAGNGEYSVRQMQVNPEMVRPRGILIMTSNEPVKMNSDRDEMRDRLYPVLMPYRRKPTTHPDQWATDDTDRGQYYVEGGKVIKPMDSSLPGKLDEEIEGITARLIHAYQDALASSDNKILKSEPMDIRLLESAAEADMFDLYLREYADLEPAPNSPTKFAKVRDLHEGYEDLCRRNRKTPMTLIGYARKLKGHSFNGQILDTEPARGGARLIGFGLSVL